MLYCRAALEMVEIAKYMKLEQSVEKYTNMYEEMKKAINESSWDGEWYKRAFDDEGMCWVQKKTNLERSLSIVSHGHNKLNCI